ncbi:MULTISPECIES: flagellar biosynthesis protein FlhB [Rhizobium/Agrobacterium group]|uniref:Flagellar biosynthetic protein FlhB n=1 Tax=Rhizobium soli TaxID=424798 RepID=A0A7X0JHN0_9HYPH|nr:MULTISPECIES: flagellar biosynthesis protein FlhB [Rhizobium/Agrobacterium group]RYE70482.1 MAG: flagellar biosynthesis protein FlhB [Rhizobiaceae bacterium]KQQ38212.1 flagellar biosynthetic protein FlhB [Rhizobium sp. Leaf306]KQQ73687.1 flagellar biosynthetic protein FlhB [Rhizobium sp. Leaf321]MBB6507748.1 flagellar biosynthetic protein FlhB [Rhizobium soli]MBD8652667.1 flagellar biosynthesis protein FlhB [Rhizobium sp. CFBP 13726]
MSDDQDKDSKTEDPTGKKIQDAMDKGNIAISSEVAIFASTLAFYIYLIFFLPQNTAHLAEVLKDLVERPEQWRIDSSADLVSLCAYVLLQSAYFMLPAAVLFMGFGLLASAGQHMPSFILERIRPQWNRISPMSGFKRLFSMQGMVHFGKSLIKIVAAGIIMYLSLRNEYFKLLDSIFSDPQTLFPILARIIKKMIIVVLACTFLVAALDIAWTRFHWFTELRMTKQEIKDEMKQSQGDPFVKARQRSIARDRARRRMINSVPRATLIITNPTHYAIALRYVAQESEAPVVVAKGQDLIAMRIREIAQEHGIPIFEDPPLARSMFAQVSVDSVIPSVFYKAVAELIHRIYAGRRQNKRMR